MVANNSRKNFLAFYKNMKEMRKEIKEGLARNIKDACEVMIEAAQENTPPCKGERRGTDTWTGELRRHWDYKISNTGLNTTVLLYNDMQYASYVEMGTGWTSTSSHGCISTTLALYRVTSPLQARGFSVWSLAQKQSMCRRRTW